MAELTIKEIGAERGSYQREIAAFFAGLSDERSYIDISEGRVMQAVALIGAFDGAELVGLTGVGSKSLFLFTFIIINKRYQGRGLGRRLTETLMARVASLRRLTFSVMLDVNVASLRQHLAAGAKLVGHRKETSYLFWQPPGPLGSCLTLLIATLFPLVRLYDALRGGGARETAS